MSEMQLRLRFDTVWTCELVAELKALVAQGLSSSEIAAKMGSGLTRNSIIGKMHRLGLSRDSRPRPKPAPRTRSLKQLHRDGARTTNIIKRVKRAQIMGLVFDQVPLDPLLDEAPEHIVPIGQRCSLIELTSDTCRWPIGHPGEEGFCFCGGKPQRNFPYCAYHVRLAYLTIAERCGEQAA